MVGRPKLPKQVRKTTNLNIRVSAAEKDEIARAARHVGASGASDWVRVLALREARKVNKEAGS
jgi:uncharacterized protein (DUF1778 family)